MGLFGDGMTVASGGQQQQQQQRAGVGGGGGHPGHQHPPAKPKKVEPPVDPEKARWHSHSHAFLPLWDHFSSGVEEETMSVLKRSERIGHVELAAALRSACCPLLAPRAGSPGSCALRRCRAFLCTRPHARCPHAPRRACRPNPRPACVRRPAQAATDGRRPAQRPLGTHIRFISHSLFCLALPPPFPCRPYPSHCALNRLCCCLPMWKEVLGGGRRAEIETRIVLLTPRSASAPVTQMHRSQRRPRAGPGPSTPLRCSSQCPLPPPPQCRAQARLRRRRRPRTGTGGSTYCPLEGGP